MSPRRLTEQQVKDREEAEANVRSQANELATMLGWSYMFVHPLRTSHGWITPTFGPLGEGWPDTTYVRTTRATREVLFVEFKKELGKVSAAQAHVHALLRAAGFIVLVIRPSTFGELAEALQRRAA